MDPGDDAATKVEGEPAVDGGVMVDMNDPPGLTMPAAAVVDAETKRHRERLAVRGRAGSLRDRQRRGGDIGQRASLGGAVHGARQQGGELVYWRGRGFDTGGGLDLE